LQSKNLLKLQICDEEIGKSSINFLKMPRQKFGLNFFKGEHFNAEMYMAGDYSSTSERPVLGMNFVH
jgi:hypothetical protein